MAFVPGWNPLYYAAARARQDTSGLYCLPAAPAKPIPKAISLSEHRLGVYNQGNAGTCWVHSAKSMAEFTMKALGYRAFGVCRRLIGFEGKRLAGGGNPSDGGSPTDAVTTMTRARGVGIAHESLEPYTDDRRKLGTRPRAAVYADAKESHLVAPVRVTTIKQAKTMIASGRPVYNGIPWPENWSQGGPFFDSIGPLVGGHSVLLIGYVSPGIWDDFGWLEFENSYGNAYRPLPADKAAKVPGYRPSTPEMTSSAWVREDVYSRNTRNQVVEHGSATDLEGVHKGIVIPGPGFADAFPI
jgi:hypothetical protein